MSREIKFRQWIGGRYNKMRYFSFKDIRADGTFAYTYEENKRGETCELMCIDCEDEEHYVMQYTGIKDKNGKEIYEGDVVKITDWPYMAHSQEKDNSSPFYKNEKVVYEETEFNLGGWLNFDYESEYEVIGNIYEHPELLK